MTLMGSDFGTGIIARIRGVVASEPGLSPPVVVKRSGAILLDFEIMDERRSDGMNGIDRMWLISVY